MYLPVFKLLNEEYLLARRLLSEGDLTGARSSLDKARSLRSRVKRQLAYAKELSMESWSKRLGFDDPSATEYSRVAAQVNIQWQLVSEWLTSVVNSIGVEELLRSDDGIDLLLDTLIPEVWDFKVDIIIIAAKDEHTYLEALLRRGQSIIIIASEDCDDAMEQSNHTIREEEATILYASGNEPLSASQVSAIDRGQSPAIAFISHDKHNVSAEKLSKLNSLIAKEFISKRALTRWPAIFIEQLILNLPSVIGLRSASELASRFRGRNTMVVSPGPSLIQSLPKIKKWRKEFVVVSLVRSLPVLFDNGILPDYAIMVDAQDHTEGKLNLIPEDPLLAEVPLLVTDFTHRTTFDLNFKEIILLPAPPLIGSPITAALHGSNPISAPGSGVASAAVTLMANLNALSITLVGQDLSVSGSGYASNAQPLLNYGAEHDHLTIQGIDGQLLATKSDFLFFKSELEAIAKEFGDKTEMINCTEFGAYIENWNHIALDHTHPAIKVSDDTADSLRIDSPGWPTLGSTEICSSAVLGAISIEIQQLADVKNAAEMILAELNRLIQDQSNDVTLLEILEQHILEAMSTEGSLIRFYCQPAKLMAEASLLSVESLEENFMVSIDYYSAILAGTVSLIDKLSEAENLLS